jgi:uncharacterized membrane protein YdbT with pleckstrin-like domain
MENNELLLRPAMRFALLKIFPLLVLSLSCLLLAWYISSAFIWFGIGFSVFAWYRVCYIRNSRYLITPEFIRISRGVFFKRVELLEMFRIKDYIITRPWLLQIMGLMHVTLKSTDPENPIIWMIGIPHTEIIDTIRKYVQNARKSNHIYEIS